MTSESFHTTKIFNHFFYWGMLTVSGDCRRVHPESIGEEGNKEEGIKKKKKPALAHSILRDLKDTGSGPRQSPRDGEEFPKERDGHKEEEEKEEEEEDDEMALLLKEMEWLKLEGNQKAAALVEKKINKIRLEKLKKIRAQ